MRSYLARAAYAVVRAFGGDPVVRAASRGVGRHVMPELSLWHQFQRVGGGLTPQQVSAIIRDADAGHMARLMDLANDARQKDNHLQAVLGTSEESIAELEWQLVLPQGAKKRDKRAAKFVEDWLRACKGDPHTEKKGLADLIAHLAGAVFYGYAVAETQYKRRDGYVVPESFDLLAHRRFGFRQEDGKFVWRDETTDIHGVDFRRDHPNKFIVSQPRVTGDVPCREGLVRVLMWAALFRSWSMTDWLRTGEIAWKPWRIGTYSKTASKEDIEDLETVLEQLTTNGWAAVPETDKIQIHWPTSSGGGSQGGQHAKLFDVVGREMSKSVLGNTEVVESSATSGYAQSKVGHTVSRTLIKSRARHIAEVITRDLIRPLILLNFGRGVAIPSFAFVTKDPVDLKAFGEGVGKLVDAGVPIPVSWALSQAGIPERKGNEPILAKPSAPTAPKPPPGTPPPGNDDEEPPAGEDDEGDGDEDDTVPADDEDNLDEAAE